MKQWNFKMKKLCTEKFKTLVNVNELNQAVHKRENSQNKAIFIIVYNIEEVEILHVSHNKVALLTTRRSERWTRNCHQITFRKV